MRVPVLTTARLRLRPFKQADLDEYAAICADAEVMRFIGAGGPVGRDAAWRHMALFLGEWALHGYGTWAVERRKDRRLIGRAGFLHPEGWPGCELAWTLARDAWGQGYAFEASRVALAYGRDQLGLGDVISLIRPDNLRSIALAERLGAQHDGSIDFMGSHALLYRHPLAGA
ncbi:MAG TPA: GNAT family N-acetyltransferase [Rubrivivax sp.]|nr:GNAT family N-acetyltransferase [Rubrivivax sp.]